MKPIQNLHTHSTYCDGADTPEQMIETALEKGFTSIGFSGHAYMPFSPAHTSYEKEEAYKKEIKHLKEVYEGRMDVFLGLEVEMYAPSDLSGFDYLIGSCHYFRFGDTMVAYDRSAEVVQKVIDDWFGGDGLAYAKAYYQNMMMLPERGDFDIIGHFDLITKHSEKITLFDAECDEYKEYAVRALESLAGKIPYFEVNTGAMSRYGRTIPYPAPFLMREMKRLGFKPVISSDCHRREYLDFGFERAAQLLRESGFTERYILTKQGFVPVSLEDDE